MRSEDPGVLIFTALSRLESYQQVVLVKQIMVAERPTISLVGESVFLYIRFAVLEPLAFASSQSCLQRLPRCSLVWCIWCSWWHSFCSASHGISIIVLGQPCQHRVQPQKKGQHCNHMAVLLVALQVHIGLHDNHGALF